MGNVGTEVVRILRDHADDAGRPASGAPVVLRGIAVRDISADRGVPAELLTTDADALVARDDVDLVVEVIGGIDPPRALILAALNAGKSVVTANKALLADYTGELAEAAERNRADLYFEAAVAGAIPVVRPLMQSLAGDRVNRVVGIVNGTTNFILSAMDETGADYADVLAEATRARLRRGRPDRRRRGLRRRRQGRDPGVAGVPHPGHRRGRATARASRGHRRRPRDRVARCDCTVKLLAICERVDRRGRRKERVSARVYPALMPRSTRWPRSTARSTRSSSRPTPPAG